MPTTALLHPAGATRGAWIGRIQAILNYAALFLAVLGAVSLFAQWPQMISRPQPAEEGPSAPHAAWFDIAKPGRLYQLDAPQFAREKSEYAARRHATGGGREDMLSFGEFAGGGPLLRLSIYRHGAEAVADATFFVDMARRAAPFGIGLGRFEAARDQTTRFGNFETAAMTMTKGPVARTNCRGFRFSATHPSLTIAGFACAGGEAAMGGADLACLVNRLELSKTGDPRDLRAFFESARARAGRGCPEPATPKKRSWLQENRAA